ncbi:uncharacterized protein F5Z01DRAFT_117931 [Emericellopsis atlantica]|uniref:Uncharacterized protein n=1 Tax=Emericellopsis atlantica TaxID=2614577 RepID=A0A9P8CPF2_9HYPO|nr:uncharacterized protein F5Z01DRAFT_117931 [Emericellopsis atlantica]KAG9254127.1 hypothetical protein F5Z01DRAFT_117931 [Emericellopsis atlantica]
MRLQRLAPSILLLRNPTCGLLGRTKDWESCRGVDTPRQDGRYAQCMQFASTVFGPLHDACRPTDWYVDAAAVQDPSCEATGLGGRLRCARLVAHRRFVGKLMQDASQRGSC